MILSTEQFILVGLEAGVPISTYIFSEAVNELLVESVTVPTVVEALNIFIRFVPSWNDTFRVPVSVKHLTPTHCSAVYAGPSGIVVVPVQDVDVA